jgi:hypothetical protein
MEGMTSINKYRSIVKVKSRGFGFLLKIHKVDETGNEFQRIEEFKEFNINVL